MICDSIMKFSLIVEKDEDGRYVVECTDLPGCMSEGETLKEAIDNIHEAIIGCLSSRLKMASENIQISSLPSHMRTFFQISDRLIP